jgi:tRNA(Ile)-lysidine synthase
MRGAQPQRAIEQHVERDGVVRKGERIVVACSGGPDSIALAAVLHALMNPLDLTLTLAYVNHGTRASAWQDECVVLRLAAMLQLPVKTVSLTGTGNGSEVALRDARYAALALIAYEVGAAAISTAHHAEDQSETVLLALFRGAGLKGLAGIAPRRALEGLELVRPLLRIPSEELREYCHIRGLPYAVDPTNADLEIRRNAVRVALAALRPLFPGVDGAIARSAHIAFEEWQARSI